MATSRLFHAALTAVVAREGDLKLSRRSPVTVREHLGAVLLDHSGWVPSDLCDGVSLFVTGDVDLAYCVEEAVARIYRRVLVGPGHRHDGGLAVVTMRSDPTDFDSAVNVGAPVLGVCEDVLELNPRGAFGLPDRMHTVELPLPPCVATDLIECVTGDRCRVSENDLFLLGPVNILRCVYGDAGEACVERLRLMSRSAVEASAAKGTPVVRAPVPSAPTPATPAGVPKVGVVRKLSEMTGFGAAGTWGCRLAKDVAAYRDGALPWSDVDRGILLSGPPGGGKTTFARALALECDLDLVATTYGAWASGTGGDMVQKGLSKLFDEWRKKAKSGPFILFWDEVESVGKRQTSSHGDYWFGPIINSWIAFLDGAIPRDGIIVVGATNQPRQRRPRAASPGPHGPGRMDRHLELPMPDVVALAGIVRMHLGEGRRAAPRRPGGGRAGGAGRSPADVQQLCREARRVARWCGRRVCASDLTDVLASQRLGQSVADTRLTAVHEAGHAVAGAVLDGDRLLSVDVDAGLTSFRSLIFASPRVIEARVVMMLAARAAEGVVLGEVTTGAARDLQDATGVATAMHAGWGMGAAGLVAVQVEVARRDLGLMQAVCATLDAAYARALDLVREHRGAVERVADALVERRYLDADEVRALVHPPAPDLRRGIRRIRAVAKRP